MKKTETVQTGLRISAALRDRLAREAAAGGVSLNSEIERRLSRSFEEGKRMKELLDHFQEMMLALSNSDDRVITELRLRLAKYEGKK
jgi:hypothetical protein